MSSQQHAPAVLFCGRLPWHDIALVQFIFVFELKGGGRATALEVHRRANQPQSLTTCSRLEMFTLNIWDVFFLFELNFVLFLYWLVWYCICVYIYLFFSFVCICSWEEWFLPERHLVTSTNTQRGFCTYSVPKIFLALKGCRTCAARIISVRSLKRIGSAESFLISRMFEGTRRRTLTLTMPFHGSRLSQFLFNSEEDSRMFFKRFSMKRKNYWLYFLEAVSFFIFLSFLL